MLKSLVLFGLLGASLAHLDRPSDYEPGPGRDVGMKPGKFGPGEETDENVEPFVDLFPPKNVPGDRLSTASIQDVNRAVDEMSKSKGFMHDRSCSMGIANTAGRRLSNPRYYLRSGMKSASWYPEIPVGSTAVNLGVKKDWTATGTVGVVTYDIDDTDYKVAVMWSTPFDFNIYDVYFNVKIYPKSYATGKHMYEQMYYYAGPWLAQGWETREEYGVKIMATMTDNIHSNLMVFVDTTDFKEEGDVEHWADCDYHAGWVKNYCWRECNKGGYCWVNKRCSSKNDCRGEMPCNASCSKTQ